MAGYEDTKEKIISSLMGRPVGTEIQPENHQDYALSMLDYVRSLELVATSTLLGTAYPNTFPLQPDNSRVCYIAGVSQNQNVIFQNFIGQDGNPISVTSGDMEFFFVVLMWNTQYWSHEIFPTSIISKSDTATFNYSYNIKKTYASLASMNADVSSPVGTDGKSIKIGDIVTVVNTSNNSENGYYSYEGSILGWRFQSSFNFQVEQVKSENLNTSPSSKLFSKELSLMPQGYQRLRIFKIDVNSHRFDNIYYAVKPKFEKQNNRHYGIVNIFSTDEGIQIDDYSWDDSGSFYPLGNIYITNEQTLMDKLLYFQNDSFEYLLNPLKLKNLIDSTSISINKQDEFDDIIFDSNYNNPIDNYLLNNNNFVSVDIDTTRLSEGYIDNNMLLPEYSLINELEPTEFNCFSYIQWVEVDYNGLLDKIEGNINNVGNIRCIAKIFDSRNQFNTALTEGNGITLLDKILTLSDWIDNSKTLISLDVSNSSKKVYKGQFIALIFIPVEQQTDSTIIFNCIFKENPYTPVTKGQPFYWISNYESLSEGYSASGIYPEYAYYEFPLKIYSKFPLEKRVYKLEQSLKNNFINPRIVLPSHLYAMVGKEFNLYYDAFMLLPDLEQSTPNILFQIDCSKGKSYPRCFRITPTTIDIGSYSFVVKVFDNNGTLIASKNSTLIIVGDENPSTQKRIMQVGDSTTDDTADVVFGIHNNLSEITNGIIPLHVGHKTHYQYPLIKHSASSGKTYSFFALGSQCLKFNFNGLPTSGIGNYPNIILSLPDGTGYIVNIETQLVGDGTGYCIANVWNQGSTPITSGFTGILKTNQAAGFPSTVNVISTESISDFSPFRFNSVIDFTSYAIHIGLSVNQYIDLLSIDLGVNDMNSDLQTEEQIQTVIQYAKLLAEAFHSYNESGKVMFCLPKSRAYRGSSGYYNQDTYRINIHRLRELLIENFDYNIDYPYCYVVGSGLCIDRKYGYPLTTETVAARYTETIIINSEVIHPRQQGYYQVADSMTAAILYLLKN